MKPRSSALFACAALSVGITASADVRIVMLRHAEKPEAGLGQLNCQGLNRALALPKVLLAAYGRPDAIYAPDPHVEKEDRGMLYNYVRPLATIEPMAIRVGLPVRTSWGWNDIQGLQAELLDPVHEGQTLLVAWEHHKLDELARNLLKARSVDTAGLPRWKSEDFDSIYVLTLKPGGGGAFRRDAEGLDGLSQACPDR